MQLVRSPHGSMQRMIKHMSHEDWVTSVRARAVEICNGVLGGSIDVLDACYQLASLRTDMEIEEGDEDFRVFAFISSETDKVPSGQGLKYWAPAALASLEPEIAAAVEWATPMALPACRSVVERFGP
ncbi:hypothetical protein [uncultured Stenotrophomonas sp.]|uniref:hypothetical protein n=1 Tax=uncultured Stenotrophomonas sp. TaxID=165438 RepID=UPI0028EBF923|nr:hypothetical protein [uncultured Stenotrophomonas sp.]